MSKENMNAVIETEMNEVEENTEMTVETKKPGFFGRIRMAKENHPVATAIVGDVVKTVATFVGGYLLGSKLTEKKYASYELGADSFVDSADGSTEDYAE